MAPERIEHIRDLTHRWVAAGVHDVVVVLIARRGTVVLHEAFRRTSRPAVQAARTDTLFPLSSLTKPITAAALMTLVDEGLVGLTRPVAEYVPEFTGEGKDDVCVHHLLTHTSGLEDPLDECERLAATTPPDPATLDATQDAFLERYLRSTYELPLHRTPGAAMAYCNLNYELLGEIIRRVSGRPFAAFCRDRVFAPLGMVDTAIAPDLEARRGSVRPIEDDDPSHDDRFLVHPSSSGGGWSTAADMAALAQVHLDAGRAPDPTVLSPHAVREMTRNQIPGIGLSSVRHRHVEASWGFGWSVTTPDQCGAAGRAFRSNISRKMHFPVLALGSFSHVGAGGMFLWGDPHHDLVGAFFAASAPGRDVPHPPWAVDLYVNATLAAIL